VGVTGTVNDMPVGLVLVDRLLRTEANDGYMQLGSGGDFELLADGQPLPFEVSDYDPATGRMVVYVKVPTWLLGAPLRLQARWGRATPVIPAPGLWDGHLAVWHFDDPVAGLDSSNNGRDGTLLGTYALDASPLGHALSPSCNLMAEAGRMEVVLETPGDELPEGDFTVIAVAQVPLSAGSPQQRLFVASAVNDDRAVDLYVDLAMPPGTVNADIQATSAGIYEVVIGEPQALLVEQEWRAFSTWATGTELGVGVTLGPAVSRATQVAFTAVEDGPRWIVGATGDGADRWCGAIDEVRILGRSNVTDAELLVLDRTTSAPPSTTLRSVVFAP
jgi:hypothetical protein